MVLVDLHPYCLDLARAVLTSSTIPNMIYVGFCDDESQRVWAESVLVAEITDLIKNGKLMVPGFTVPLLMPQQV